MYASKFFGPAAVAASRVLGTHRTWSGWKPITLESEYATPASKPCIEYGSVTCQLGWSVGSIRYLTDGSSSKYGPYDGSVVLKVRMPGFLSSDWTPEHAIEGGVGVGEPAGVPKVHAASGLAMTASNEKRAASARVGSIWHR